MSARRKAPQHDEHTLKNVTRPKQHGRVQLRRLDVSAFRSTRIELICLCAGQLALRTHAVLRAF